MQSAATDLGFTAADVTAAFTSVGVTCGAPDGGGGADIDGGPLSNGVTKTGLANSTGYSVNFTMAVPAGSSALSFVTSGGNVFVVLTAGT